MAASSSTQWGDIVNDACRIGIYPSLSSTNTTTTVTYQVWFWSKFSVTDSANKLYFSATSTTPEYQGKNFSIGTTINSTVNNDGVTWNTGNQVRIATYTQTFTRTTSKQTKKCSAKFTGIDKAGDDLEIVASYTIPALAHHTVSYNANGGTGVPDSQTKYSGTDITLSSTVPTRDGYTFLCWNTASDGTGTSYNPSATYSVNQTANVTLYAIWEANTYYITYDANGGEGTMDTDSIVYYQNYTAKENTFTKTGYSFSHWYDEEHDVNWNGWIGREWRWNYTYDVTLMAQWVANSYTVTLNFEDEKTEAQTLTLTYDSSTNSDVSAYIPTRPGYKFLGFFTEDGVLVYNPNGVCAYNSIHWTDGVCSYAGDYVVYARWEAQNVAYYKIDGAYVLCNTYIKVNGSWQPGIVYRKTDGVYRRSVVSNSSSQGGETTY